MNKHKVNFLLSCAMGLMFGLVMAVPLLFLDRELLFLAPVAGVMFALAMFAVITVCVGRTERKLRALDSKIPQTVLFRHNGIVQVEGKTLMSWLSFGENSLFLLSVEAKSPVCQEIPYGEIDRWEQSGPGTVILHKTDGSSICFQVAVEQFLRTLKETNLM